MNTWLKDNNLIIKNRQGMSNIVIEDGDDSDSHVIAVYCSSNGIYFPNDEKTFCNRIIDQNKYDWKNNRFLGVRAHIYIRDLWKQWYVEGVNAHLNSIDRVAHYLQNWKKRDDQFIFLGSSAGGYMACILACILGGTAYAFSPQITLSLEEKNWLLLRHSNDVAFQKWYDINDKILGADAEFFIFFGKRNLEDVHQLMRIKNCKRVFLLPFSTNKHGVVCFSSNVRVFNKKKEKLKKIATGGVPKIS